MRDAIGLALLLLTPLACRGAEPAASGAPAASVASTPAAAALSAVAHPDPVPAASVSAAVNPAGLPAYSGPIARVRGVVRVSGDLAPTVPEVVAKIPSGRCDDARAFYGKLFREGAGRTLGDVLVAVTGYEGYVPVPAAPRRVVASGCAFESRTLAVAIGQRLEVANRGPEAFTPQLVGAPQAALLVAMPGGDPVELFPRAVGSYVLIDRSHEFATADVFVLKFPTFAVTGLDGRFEISGVPHGTVKVSALLPATGATVTREVALGAGEPEELELVIPFDASRPRAAAP